MPTSQLTLEFVEDPAAVLTAAEAYLGAEPVLSTVVATVTQRALEADRRGEPRPDHPRWWVLVRGASGQLVGVAMRTAPFAPHPVFALPMPEDAAVELARRLDERGETIGGVNGALPAAQVLAGEAARRSGGRVRVHEHTRLFQLDDLVVPPAPPGRLRSARAEDAELALSWFRRFEVDAAEQAGRRGTHAMGDSLSLEDMHRRIESGCIWLWEDEHGEPVHLTGAHPPAFGVTRIGPVYTPAAHRGHGYAGATVAEVSRRFVEQGVRCCLFTDQANPTSNRIYQAIGYRRVVDMVNLVVERGPGPDGP